MKKLAMLALVALILPAMAFAGYFDFSVGTTAVTDLSLADINSDSDIKEYFETNGIGNFKPGIEVDAKLSILEANITAVFGNDDNGDFGVEGLVSAMVSVDAFFVARFKFGAAIAYRWDSNGLLFNNLEKKATEVIVGDETTYYSQDGDILPFHVEHDNTAFFSNYLSNTYTTTSSSLLHAQIYARAGIDIVLADFEISLYAYLPTCACFGESKGVETFFDSIKNYFNLGDDYFGRSYIGLSFRYNFF